MYKIALKRSAKKELSALAEDVFKKIDEAVMRLKANPYPHPQSKSLKGEDIRRLRAGDYRVIYSVDESSCVVTIIRIRHRREAYR